jgi:hypothetical protein
MKIFCEYKHIRCKQTTFRCWYDINLSKVCIHFLSLLRPTQCPFFNLTHEAEVRRLIDN